MLLVIRRGRGINPTFGSLAQTKHTSHTHIKAGRCSSEYMCRPCANRPAQASSQDYDMPARAKRDLLYTFHTINVWRKTNKPKNPIIIIIFASFCARATWVLLIRLGPAAIQFAPNCKYVMPWAPKKVARGWGRGAREQWWGKVGNDVCSSVSGHVVVCRCCCCWMVLVFCLIKSDSRTNHANRHTKLPPNFDARDLIWTWLDRTEP